MKTWAFFLATLIALTTQVWAKDPPEAWPRNPQCVCDPNDPFDPKAKLPAGKYKGQCSYSCRLRSVNRLSPVGALPYLPDAEFTDSVIYAANVQHEGKFWVARIDLTQVKDLYLQRNVGKGLLDVGHGQLRFEMKPSHPIELVRQVFGT